MTLIGRSVANRPKGLWHAPRLSCVLLATVLSSLGAGSGRATTFNIANGDVAGLKNAINTANGNGFRDTINLAAGGTYTLTTIDNLSNGANGLPVIYRDVFAPGTELAINGNGATLQRSLAGGTPSFRILQVAGGASVTISNLTLAHGTISAFNENAQGGGAIYNNGSTVGLFNCFVHSNSAGVDWIPEPQYNANGRPGGTGRGGAVCSVGGTLTLTDCTFSSNLVIGGQGGATENLGSSDLQKGSGGAGRGGAVHHSGSVVHVTRCTFRSNRAFGGPGGDCVDGPCAEGRGGAAVGGAFDTDTEAVLTDCIFNENNFAQGGVDGNGSVRRTGVDLGGAISLVGGTVERCVFDGNSADFGGALHNRGGTLAITESTFRNNSAPEAEGDSFFGPYGGGGAIYLNVPSDGAADVTLSKCTLEGNRSGGNGGAIRTSKLAGRSLNLTVSQSSLQGNIATADGGGIHSDAEMLIRSSTFSGNSARLGGGIHQHGSSARASNATLADNTGGAIYLSSATLTLENTLLLKAGTRENLANENGTVISLGNNLSSDAAGGDSTAAPGGLLDAPGDIRNTNPQLLPLAENGGPTPTRALASTSPAIGAGHDGAPPRDQRGYFRTGRSDIGAYEFNGGYVGSILAITRNGADLAIQFEAIEGLRYRLQQKLELTDPSWQTVPRIADRFAPGDTDSFLHPSGANRAKAFYRVRWIGNL